MLDTNPRDTLKILLGNSWTLDADRPTTVGAFPHVGSPTINRDRVITNFGEVAGHIMRGWLGHVEATDGL